MAQPWAKQKNETSRNYGYFEIYRLMGPDRSLLGAYNLHLAERGVKKRSSIPSSWQKNSEKFDWKDRSEAWDEQERKKLRKEGEEARQRVRKARVALIEKGISKLREALDVVDPESAKFGEIMSGIKTLSEQARIEFGEAPTVSEVTFEILQGVSSGDISIRDAAMRFNREGLAIPKAVEMMLAKEPPEETEVDEGRILSEEELEARYQAAMAAVKEEEERFLPERRAEVEAIKAELADKDQWKHEMNESLKNS